MEGDRNFCKCRMPDGFKAAIAEEHFQMKSLRFKDNNVLCAGVIYIPKDRPWISILPPLIIKGGDCFQLVESDLVYLTIFTFPQFIRKFFQGTPSARVELAPLKERTPPTKRLFSSTPPVFVSAKKIS